jgi:tetratricopeptide (TPR) repeat protein
VLPPEAYTLAEAMRRRGYRTGAFVSAFVLDARWGLAQGFEMYDGPPVAPGQVPASPAEAERIGAATVDAALDWLAAEEDRAWFAWVHLFDPHAPYAAPEPYRSIYSHSPYDGEVAYADALVGRLREWLEQRGAWEDTTVILTSDHGEALGEHGEPAHGFFLYEATLRVPLIIRAAGGAGARGGAVRATPVALIDVFPTVADLWNLDAGDDIEGRSLGPALRGEALDRVPIYSETLLPRLYFGWHDLRAITDGREKFIAAPREELYDLSTDAGETTNLADDRPERADELRELLEASIERSESGAIGADVVADDPDRAAALRSLGYLNVGGGSDATRADPKDKIEVYAAMMAALGAWELGDTEQALGIIDEQIAADAEFAGAHHFRGLVLAGSGRYQEAAAAFERALEIDPEHALAGRELARAYRTLGNNELAAITLNELLALQPADVDLRWELADVLMRDRRWNEARQALQEGLEITPDAPRLHFGAGVVALQEGAPQQALAAFDHAARIAPDLPNLQFRRGQALEALGRPEEALGAYAAEADRQPRHYFALFGRARLLAATGASPDVLVEALRAALAARPGAPEAALFLAQVLVDRGDPEDLPEAEELASAAVFKVQVPQLRAMGHSTLAQIYEAQGRDEEAAQQRAAAERAGSGR